MEGVSLDSPACTFPCAHVYLCFYKPAAFGPFFYFYFLLIVLSVPHRGGRRGRLAVFPVGDALMLSPGGKRRSLAVSLPPLCHSALTTASKVTERRRSPLSFRDISRVASLGSEFDFSPVVFPLCRLQEACDTGSV